MNQKTKTLEEKFKKEFPNIDITTEAGDEIFTPWELGYSLAQKELQSKLDSACEVIRFYADKEKYKETIKTFDDHRISEVQNEEGERARNFLQGLGE